jgi:hypothetical protein
MILFWRIRYFDTIEKQFKDRDLWLDTETVDAVTKAAIETCNELKEPLGGRGMIKYRHLFKPEAASGEMHDRIDRSGKFATVFIHDYHEDENGNQLSRKELGVAITGDETAVMLPPGAKQHDIDLIFADKPVIDVGKLSLTPDELKVLGYFARDLKEMTSSAFFKEGPGTLSSVAISPRPPRVLRTAVNDEEIRSFLTVFRRLYMKNEPANFERAVEVFSKTLTSHPVAKWVAAGAAEVTASLTHPPAFAPFAAPRKPTFTVKLLIDVFLYTQFAHQPDQRRTRQFQECLQELGNDRAALTYLFLTEVWRMAIEMSNVGQQIAQLFDVYCAHHAPSHDIVSSAADAHPGIGVLEKSHQRQERVLGEKAEELATAMWREAGKPSGGPHQFAALALKQLRDSLGAEGKAK